MERRLSTVLAADVVGYSALMHRSEAETVARLKRLRERVQTHAGRHGARVISWSGDGVLVEFPSPVSAVRSAFELQQELAAPHVVAEIGLTLRIGIHLADVISDGDDLLGDGVNVAARIEAEAEPGAVYLSRVVFDQAKRGAQLRFQPLGARQLKNIADPVELFVVAGELEPHSYMSALVPEAAAALVRRDNGVVVVPFQNKSADIEQEYFADGLTEDLITELSRFQGVFVISRNASLALKGRAQAADRVCANTGVRYCVEGDVRRLGGRVRISCHMTDGATGDQLWSEKYDCPLDDLFDVQDDMLAKVAAAVAGRVERQEEDAARRKPTADMEAYDCLLRGLEFHRIGGVTRENAEAALDWFERALEKDPEFGRAHAWRACAMATRDEWLGVQDRPTYWDIGRRGLELDSDSAEVHRIMGSLSLYREDFDAALDHYNRALKITPNHAYIVGHVGAVHNYLGDGVTALEHQRRAEALDPSLPEYCREVGVIAHYVLGDWEACYRAATAFPRITRRAAAYRAAAALHLDDDERLARAVRRLATVHPGFDPEVMLAVERFRAPERNAALRRDLEDVCAQMPVAPLRAAG